MKKRLKACSIIGTVLTREREEYYREAEKYREELRKILKELLKEGYRHFLFRVKLGAEMDIAEMIAYAKKQYPDIFLEMVMYEGECMSSDETEEEMLQFINVRIRTNELTHIRRAKVFWKNDRKTRYMLNKSELFLILYKEENEKYCCIEAVRAQKKKKIIRWACISSTQN